jgi:TolB-like protein
MIAARFPILERQELVLAARNAITNELSVARTAPRPGTIAVFPFTYQGRDPGFEPLGRAIAEMVVTDLSQTDRLVVLERMRVQLLLDEMELGQFGLADPATGARSGRLLGAERIVQGSLNIPDDDQARMQAMIVGTVSGEPVAPPAVEQDEIQRLFEVEKRLVFDLYASLGIQLAAAERDRISRTPTNNIQALLAFGQCLEAEDVGDYRAAITFCQQAVTIDPNFTEAIDRVERESVALESAEVTVDQLARRGVTELADVDDLAGADGPAGEGELAGNTGSGPDQPSDIELIQSLVPGGTGRVPAAEVFGGDEEQTVSIIRVIINSPSGAP